MGFNNEPQNKKLSVGKHRLQMFGEIPTSKIIIIIMMKIIILMMIKVIIIMMIIMIITMMIMMKIMIMTMVKRMIMVMIMIMFFSKPKIQGHVVKLTLCFVTNF